MNSRTKITLGVVALVIIVLILIFSTPFHSAEAPIASNVPKEQSPYDSVAYSTSTDDVETSSVSIHIVKPKVTGLASAAINDAVNRQIDSTFADIKKSFIADTDGVKILSDDTKHQLTVTGSEPLSATDKTFYVDVEIYSYYSGAAHPLTQRIVLNFVKETGQLIRLQDLLKKDTGAAANAGASVSANADSDMGTDIDGTADDLSPQYKTALTAISRMAKPKIIAELTKISQSTGARGGDDDSADGNVDMSQTFEESGTDPVFDNYGVFYIHKDNVEWVFGQYQVAPYVFGEVKISIPRSDLNPYLADREWLK